MKPVGFKSLFVCQRCGAQSPKWQGRCSDCDSWNSFVEERVRQTSHAAAGGFAVGGEAGEPVPLPDIPVEGRDRLTSIGELDRVLGGGLVRGGVVLLGGAPGIGKSTLLLQTAAILAGNDQPVLYVSGEESLGQTKLRAERLGIASRSLSLLYEIRVDEIVRTISALRPALAVIDSVQTLFTEALASAPGSVGQVRESAGSLIRLAKSMGIPMILVGHITKDGTLAGPRVLEHMVDTVLHFEGEAHFSHRLLRAVKNRFGGTHEVGIFTMGARGLVEVRNPSEFFLAERAKGGSGSVVVTILEGYRPLLVELQALVTRSYMGVPRRVVTGLDLPRVNILLAVLEKRCRLPLGQWDLFMNVVGAMKVREPAADLGIALAVASSFADLALPFDALLVGEVGLGGEVRAVSRLEARLREGQALGFTRAVVPRSQAREVSDLGMAVTGVGTVTQAMAALGVEVDGREKAPAAAGS